MQQSIQELRGKLRHLLHLPVPRGGEDETTDKVSSEMEKHITLYLQQTTGRYDLSQNVQVLLATTGHTMDILDLDGVLNALTVYCSF